MPHSYETTIKSQEKILSDETVVIQFGEKIAEGTPEKIAKDENIIRRCTLTTIRQDATAAATGTFWIIGGGYFGRRAAQLLRKNTPAGRIVVVDKLPVHGLPEDIDLVCADGVNWLAEHLTPDSHVDNIIPALPVHLAADWLKTRLLKEQRVVCHPEIVDAQLSHFPHPIRVTGSRIVMSHADFHCPPNCSEPDVLCTYTQKPRPQSLYRLLATLDCGDFSPLILQSRQFHPGVGGFFPEDLWHLLERVRALPDTPLLIGTACKCHGIVDSLLHREA